jgi:hypothetical protein
MIPHSQEMWTLVLNGFPEQTLSFDVRDEFLAFWLPIAGRLPESPRRKLLCDLDEMYARFRAVADAPRATALTL